MSELTAFDNRIDALIAALSPQRRKALATEIAKRLRKHQQQRIKRQVTPEGKPFTPR